MAKKSSIEKNERRRKLAKKYSGRRVRLKLAELPRNSSGTRVRNRCAMTGRPRAYYRKLKMSRIALRDLGGKGMIPGLVKSSW